MAKTWVLETDTKGTGARLVPIDKASKRSSQPERLFVPPKPQPREPQPPAPRAPRRFRVMDVMTRRNLADDVSAAEALDVLKDVRSIVDVSISVWQEERDRWRPLTFSERRAMFDLIAA